jgi:hypothetical protein
MLMLTNSCAATQTRPTQGQQAQPAAQPSSARTPNGPAQATAPAQSKPASERTPSETVRAFYAFLRARRVREAFDLSIYRSIVGTLSPEEFEELRPEFEKLGEAVPPEIGIYGEQISGDRATVFAVISTDPGAKQEAIDVIRADGAWLVGSRENYDAVRREGKELFFKARVETHHEEVRQVLVKIANAEAAYAAQNGGAYADLPALARTEMAARIGLADDLDALPTLGYRVTFAPGKGEQGYRVGAEPLRYGRTGRLSFYMDKTGIQTKDNGGKPFSAPPLKKKG